MAPRPVAPFTGWAVWGRPMLALGLILFGPLALLGTPLHWLASQWAVAWILLLVGVLWALGLSVFISLVTSQPPGMLHWLEQRLRAWVAWFAPEPALLWLHWARRAHHPRMAQWCLDQAVARGHAEAVFQEGLVFLEGGFGAGGGTAAVRRFRRAAAQGHPEAAFRLAEELRLGSRGLPPEHGEAEKWYLRAAGQGFEPAARWLAHAYGVGDGVMPDETKARHWSKVATGLVPVPTLSHSLLRHDAAPEDPLVRVFGEMGRRAEAAGERLVASRYGRWALFLVLGLLTLFAVGALGAFFWSGSSGLYHLPLLVLVPPFLLLAWQALSLRREGPRLGRDCLLEAAEAGDAEACYDLGLAYRAGHPPRPRDDLSAVLWFRRAAESGHPLAMLALSDAYLGGHGVPRDPRAAAQWAEAARRESTSKPGQPIKPPR